MRLAVSNIAWDAPEQAAVLDLLGSRAVRGIELAPTKLWPEWRGASPEAARTARAELADRFADTPFAPKGLIQQLAKDAIEVAAPIAPDSG